MPIANRCSSPPLKFLTSRSRTCLKSSRSTTSSLLSLSSFPLNIVETVASPLIARGMWSTYCGLIRAFMLSSSTFVKKFCSSDPRKYLRISCQSGGSLTFVNQCQRNDHCCHSSGTHIVAAEVWLLFSCKDLQRSALSDSVCPDQAQNLTRSWRRQPMELEAVCAVAMRSFRFQVGRQFDDGDGLKGALFGALLIAVWTRISMLFRPDVAQRKLTIPQPMQSCSEMKAILSVGVTSMHSLPEGRRIVSLLTFHQQIELHHSPMRTTGHDFLHSCRHFFGLHLSVLTAQRGGRSANGEGRRDPYRPTHQSQCASLSERVRAPSC